MTRLTIDGAHGEGGGQVARLAMALAAITGRGIELVNIRAGRGRPGLAAQHLAALRAVARVSRGELEGAALGAGRVSFRPGPLGGGDYHFDVGTAGSIALVVQAVLPVVLRAAAPSRLHVVGGSDVKMAPTLDYLRLVIFPWLAAMGAEVHVCSVRHGYYPRGGGKLVLEVVPGAPLRPITAASRGTLRAIRGRAHVSHLAAHIAERLAASARPLLADLAPPDIATEVLGDDQASGAGGALILTALTDSGPLGAAVVAQRGVTAERLGEEAARRLRTDLLSGATLDVHAGDQLLVYAALAIGDSRFSVREVSTHAGTAMWLIEQFLPVRFRITAMDGRKLVEVRRIT